tara:strand:- start:257 stop:754 length:498 start_codon:yes stop_codon:yes gene_type:complete
MYEENSLDFLERNKGKCQFDIIIVDGDHNYYTVLKELNLLLHYAHENTIIVCDDYYGKYSKEDLYYSDRDAYDNVSIATRIDKSERTAKKGVKTAVDEFVNQPDCPFELEGFKNTSWCLLRHKNRALELYSVNGRARDDILVLGTKAAFKESEKAIGEFSSSPFI